MSLPPEASAADDAVRHDAVPPRLREMLRFLQKRKFRLVTRWRLAVRDAIGRAASAHPVFPYGLVFRAFDQAMRELKAEGSAHRDRAACSILVDANIGAPANPDHYLALFTTGRDLFAGIVAHDPAFQRLFAAAERRAMDATIDRVFQHMIERELREHARRAVAAAGTLQGAQPV